MATDTGCQCGNAASTCQSKGSTLALWPGTPVIAGSCRAVMVMAMPSEKPCSTGREIKFASAPARRAAAARKQNPAARTAASEIAAVCKPLSRIDRISAARIAADEEVGATIAKRLRPDSA